MIQALLNIFAPDDCIECGQEGQPWCEWCRLGHEALPSRCFRCHAMTDDYATCASCKTQTPVKRLYVYAEYTGVNKQAVRVLKFGAKRHMAHPIARQIAELLPVLPADTIITNVPTAPLRVRQRGFDHTKLIARQVAKLTKQRYQPLLLKTNSNRQVGASRDQRTKQAQGAYELISVNKVVGKRILLIDDVVTSGATLSECVKVLHAAGAKQVDCAVFAYSK
jgi:competence protein ComFC